jgi:small conductance mechanosensitive channel
MDTLSQFFGHTATQVVAIFVVALIIHKIIGKIIEKAVQRAMRFEKFVKPVDRKKREKTLVAVFRAAANVVLWTLSIILILMVLDVNVPALLTGAGLIGIVVGFGAQSTIKDLLAGIFISTENQYRVGDIVTLHATGGPVSGVVEDFSLRVTKLRDLDGNLHIVENGASSEVTNLSFKFANVNIDVRVGYDSDIDKVEAVINKLGNDMAADKEWKEHILEPIQFLRVDEFEDAGVRIKSLGKVVPSKQWDISGEFRRRLLKEFKRNGIAIAYPQMIIHQDSQSAEKSRQQPA